MLDIDKLISYQRDIQKQMGYPIEDDSIDTKCELLKDYSFGALDEIHESIREFSWKTWAKDSFINEEEYVSELADEMLFLINRLAVINCSEEKFVETINKKIDKNISRLSSGYAQRSRKCEMCGRALDDHFSIEQIEANNIKLCKICQL